MSNASLLETGGQLSALEAPIMGRMKWESCKRRVDEALHVNTWEAIEWRSDRSKDSRIPCSYPALAPATHT